MLKKTLLPLLALIASLPALAQETVIQYLSGTDKDHTVAWDFMCTEGARKGEWQSIKVPSNWEQQGFGTYHYHKETADAEKGLYKYSFKVAPEYKGKKIFIVFEGSMTDTKVEINGQLAGPIHQGGFYQFRYEITSLVKFDGVNLLQVEVGKHSSNSSVNAAERNGDFWLFGGIFRPVYLDIVPPNFIERVAIDATAAGDLNMRVFHNAGKGQNLEAQLFELNGRPVDGAFRISDADSIMTHHFSGIKLWNPEQPNLYYVQVSLKEGEKTLHTIRQRLGFRTAELRPLDGFYVNGHKIIFKGVCRHSEWPETGRTLSRDIHLLDIGLMKDMNMNAVRMSHYPPDREFLDLCDSLGLFVLDELTGWQAAYDTVVGRKLVKELVVRDVNHPSIVLWDNGNEGGWNRALDGDFALYDPQKRHVIHPWERFDGTNTKHYPDYRYIQTEVANAKEVFFPTEFMHGLFDGGQGAALEDFWSAMMQHPHAAGGFLWSFHDEGIRRKDRSDSIDVAGNQAPDGIVGPHREKEASYYTIKELWSPVYIDRTATNPTVKGKLTLENRYLFTNLNQCRLEWKWVSFPPAGQKKTEMQVWKKGNIAAPSLAPGEKGEITIPLTGKEKADALYLWAFDAKGDTICTWSWTVRSPEQIVKVEMGRMNIPKGIDLSVTDRGEALIVSCDRIEYRFDKRTGFLQSVYNGQQEISLGGGPALAGSTSVLEKFDYLRQGNEYIITPAYKGDSLRVKWVFQPGRLPRLEYSYRTKDSADYMGITFNYPEEKIKGMKWMGRGPYRVWKNREKGQQFGVWEKAYNNTVTGESWGYPEFKGWHANLYWVTLQNKEADFTVYTDRPDVYLEMGQPEKPTAASNNNTSPPFPEGTLGFMNGISAMGTKFQRPELLGPQSQKNGQPREGTLEGTLYFDFR
ncbi:MAG TPA: glycoside hydrolase family 2 TIM barrel-domain containing protein [Puia sp.]|nr:glycoside hydrolase family 2 TIM barrel-domain containing protein [Puia sp.]